MIGEITAKVTLLAKKEVELAKTELKADLTLKWPRSKGSAWPCWWACFGLNMFLTAIALTLAAYLPAWLAALLIGGVLVIVAAILGYASWTRRVTSPLAATRRTLKEDAQWAKERLA